MICLKKVGELPRVQQRYRLELEENAANILKVSELGFKQIGISLSSFDFIMDSVIIQGGFLFFLKDKVSGSLALNLLDSQGWPWTHFLRDCKLSQWAPAWLRPRVTWDKDINWRITFIRLISGHVRNFPFFFVFDFVCFVLSYSPWLSKTLYVDHNGLKLKRSICLCLCTYTRIKGRLEAFS